MKRVFSKTREVVDVWAAQSQFDARANSTSFKGPRLYSYSTVIAKHVITRQGAPSVLISTGGFGTTTATVIGQARTACERLGVPLFTVINPDGNPATNLAHYERQIEAARDAATRARNA